LTLLFKLKTDIHNSDLKVFATAKRKSRTSRSSSGANDKGSGHVNSFRMLPSAKEHGLAAAAAGRVGATLTTENRMAVSVSNSTRWPAEPASRCQAA
jgi:hypothetical protein